MSDDHRENLRCHIDRRRAGSSTAQPPPVMRGPIGWLRANLFSSWISGAITLLLALPDRRARFRHSCDGA